MQDIISASRRGFLVGGSLALGTGASAAGFPAGGFPAGIKALARSEDGLLTFASPQDPRTIAEPPHDLPGKEGYADVPGARLYYRDTGGPGQVIVLEHAGTGSALSWAYQYAVFAAAGYRVIGYSRRGQHLSQELKAPARFQAITDLDNLANALGVKRFHLIGVAAGGYVTTYYSLAHPDRVISAVIACSRAGIMEAKYDKAVRELMPAGAIETLPHDFIELGASYRMGNPAGVKRWLEIFEDSFVGRRLPQPGFGSHPDELGVSWERFSTFKPPLHLIAGDADLYTPPVVARMQAEHRPGTGVTIFGETGHSAQWEQPAIFNDIVLSFLRSGKV